MFVAEQIFFLHLYYLIKLIYYLSLKLTRRHVGVLKVRELNERLGPLAVFPGADLLDGLDARRLERRVLPLGESGERRRWRLGELGERL